MNEDQVQISVTSGAVTVGVLSMSSKEEIKKALDLALKVIQENSESISALNNKIPANAKKDAPQQSQISKKIASNIKKLKVSQLAILALTVYGDQTRSQIKDKIENWGKPVTQSFPDNFSRDFLKTGLMREVGRSDDGDVIYGLTERGKVESEKILNELEGDSNG